MKWKDFMSVKNHFCPIVGSRYTLKDMLQRQFSSCDKPAFAKKIVLLLPPRHVAWNWNGFNSWNRRQTLNGSDWIRNVESCAMFWSAPKPPFFFSLNRIYLLFEAFGRKNVWICLNPRFSKPSQGRAWSVTRPSFRDGGTENWLWSANLSVMWSPWKTHWALTLVKGIREPHEVKKKLF